MVIMRDLNLASVDLNLLPALEALLHRRHVTRAAEDVGLSQPAMSHVLARLRRGWTMTSSCAALRDSL
jgi:hypothetical protein